MPILQSPEGDTFLEPLHPGQLLKTYLAKDPGVREGAVTQKTNMALQELRDIADCKSPIDEKAALELTKVFGPAAEFWFRMQFAYDAFQKTGREPDKADLPMLPKAPEP